MQQHNLKDSLELLKAFREEVQDKLDSSRLDKLDNIIGELDKCTDKDSSKALSLLGDALKLLPWIERIISHF